jgi:hypothetical protein
LTVILNFAKFFPTKTFTVNVLEKGLFLKNAEMKRMDQVGTPFWLALGIGALPAHPLAISPIGFSRRPFLLFLFLFKAIEPPGNVKPWWERGTGKTKP